MVASITTKELRNMPLKDLLTETGEKRAELQKMKIGIDLNKEKDTAKYRREKRTFARMMTILTEKQKEALKTDASSPTVSAPKRSKKNS